jgi:hypothetical protein
MSMLRKALLVGLSATIGLVGSWSAAAAGGFFAEEPPQTTGVPFSAVATTQSVTAFADGNRIVRTNVVRYFRDGKGRTRTERGDGPNRLISINDPVSGARYIVRPAIKAVVAYKISGGGPIPAALNGAPADDDTAQFGLLGFGMRLGAGPDTEASSSTTSLGQQTVNGVAATGSRLVRNIPGGVLGNEKPITSTLDRWINADLGIPVQVVQKSSIGGQLTLNLGNIVRAEPDAALFAPPADYSRKEIELSAQGAYGLTASSP